MYTKRGLRSAVFPVGWSPAAASFWVDVLCAVAEYKMDTDDKYVVDTAWCLFHFSGVSNDGEAGEFRVQEDVFELGDAIRRSAFLMASFGSTDCGG